VGEKIMPRPFLTKDFADEPLINLRSRLVKIPNMISANRKNGIELEKFKSMTSKAIRVEFAQRLNDGRLTFSTHSHKHLDDMRTTNQLTEGEQHEEKRK